MSNILGYIIWVTSPTLHIGYDFAEIGDKKARKMKD